MKSSPDIFPEQEKFESRVRLEISLPRLKNNFQKIARTVSPCSITAVLKANAYGLGVREVAKAVRDAGAAAFGVAEINEALQLKELGLPIQILGNILPHEIAPAVNAGIICPINDLATAKIISAEAIRQEREVECHLLLDTGMGRLGMVSSGAGSQIAEIIKLPKLKCSGIYSHFPVAYHGENSYTIGQMRIFRQLLDELAAIGITFKKVHMANSDAVNNFPESARAPFNAVRVGLNMYGYYDNTVRHSLELEPVIELKTRLASVRTLPAGASIGYGRTYRLIKETPVGTVAAGYADGLPLALSNRGYVLIRGRLCPVLGRVSMDYTTVSLENVSGAQCGDEVVCIGHQGDMAIPLDNWVQIKGTHAYDLLCSFGSRVKRVYLKN